MPAVRTDNTSYIGKEFLPTSSFAPSLRRHTFTAPIAPGNTNIHSAVTLPDTGTTVVTTGITNPDIPRVVRIKGNAAGIAGNVVVAGTDIRNVAITDTIASSGTSAVDGVKAFKTITSITMPTKTNSSGDTISVGFGAALGLGRKMDSDGVIKSTVDGAADSALPTVAYSATNISQNTVILATAPNGTHNYIVTYLTTERYVVN